MAIYTHLTPVDFELISSRYGLGQVVEAKGIPQGSINSNFQLTTQHGRYFVRHTTVRSESELEFEASLLEHLASNHLSVPRMLRVEGQASIQWANGRVCLFTYLQGEEKTKASLTAENVASVGKELARFHAAARGFSQKRSNPYATSKVREWLSALALHSDSEVSQTAVELLEVAAHAMAAPAEELPQGIIHADLFLDNVKWLDNKLSAFFDFEMACQGEWVYDLAITLNAWCYASQYQSTFLRSLLSGYESVRLLTPAEWEALHSRLLLGAIRFTASRIRDFHLSPLPSEQLARKNFRTYLQRVRDLQNLGPRGFTRLCKP